MQLRVHLKSLHHALYHQSDALVLPVVFQIYTPQLQPLLDSLLSPQLHRSCATIATNNTFLLGFHQLQVPIHRKNAWRCRNRI